MLPNRKLSIAVKHAIHGFDLQFNKYDAHRKVGNKVLRLNNASRGTWYSVSCVARVVASISRDWTFFSSSTMYRAFLSFERAADWRFAKILNFIHKLSCHQNLKRMHEIQIAKRYYIRLSLRSYNTNQDKFGLLRDGFWTKYALEHRILTQKRYFTCS